MTVAVIDTGVDYTHPDLEANMWINHGEIPGNGVDDDNNGYVDDVYGANTIADNGGADGDEGDPMDDHGHGTHVAGIIAGVNNTVGIVGVAYNAKIMAVKAGQSTGVFNQSDIAEAILYAYEMGADVINMSFGGSACSIAVQEALETAYTRSTLVASAGNDGKPNEATDNYEHYGEYMPNYPAALSYVIGVMSIGNSGVESAFTNWDVAAYNSVEYELYAPGEGILSTLPGGRYGRMSGTSMAAPVVSGAAALLRSYFADRNTYTSRFISAQLSATSGDTAVCRDPEDHAVNGAVHNLPMRLNVYDALTKLPQPDVALYDWYMFDKSDSEEGSAGDGVADAGETIEIGAVLRNRWGMSENTVVSIDAGSNPYVEIINGSADFEGVGTYSTKDMLIYNEQGAVTGAERPLVVKIADNCPNDYLISLNVTVTYGNGLDDGDGKTYTSEGTIEFWARNGVVKTGQITEDETWTKDNYYIIPSSLYIAEGATVTVEPGTQIQFWSDDPDDPYADTYIAYLQVAGNFIVNGTEEEPVNIFPSDIMSQYEVCISGKANLNYAHIVNATLSISSANHCKFTQNYPDGIMCRYMEGGIIKSGYRYYSDSIISHSTNWDGCFSITKAENCIFDTLGGGDNNRRYTLRGRYNTCIFKDCGINFGAYIVGSTQSNTASYQNCVFTGNDKGQSSYVIRNSLGGNYGEIKKVVSNAQTQTTYISLYAPMVTYGFEWGFDFIEYIGAQLACLETEDEVTFVAQRLAQGSNGVIGLKNGENIWINGAPVGDYLTIVEGDFSYAVLNYNIQKGATASFDVKSDHYIIEMPFHEDGTEWTMEEIKVLLDSFIKKGLNNTQFKGNAILNNFYDTNVENWFQITAQDDSSKKFGIGGNWWGTTDEEFIERQIVDFDDYSYLGDIIVGEYLTTPPEDTFPFVTDAYLLNSSGERVRTVGNETVTFVVEFNRDMDTSMPLRVRFGAAEPYAEYEIEGDYISARRWGGDVHPDDGHRKRKPGHQHRKRVRRGRRLAYPVRKRGAVPVRDRHQLGAGDDFAGESDGDGHSAHLAAGRF